MRKKCMYDQHYVDNQGVCHGCGKPLNSDYGIAYYGEEGWAEVVANWEKEYGGVDSNEG